MSRNELIDILLNRFYEGFAVRTAQLVMETDQLSEIYELATSTEAVAHLSPADRDKVIVRTAYVLETVYFMDKTNFKPFIDRFYIDFISATNGSVQRHFSKIMADVLQTELPEATICESIAEVAADWVTNKKIRVAVKIWAMEVLFLLSGRVNWVKDVLPEIIEPLMRDPSPAMIVRLKRWKDVRTM